MLANLESKPGVVTALPAVLRNGRLHIITWFFCLILHPMVLTPVTGIKFGVFVRS